MANTVTVDAKTFNTIINRLDELSKEVEVLKALVFKKNPKYGSDEWWEKEIKEAKENFKKGKGIKFNSAKEAIAWLNS
jgi:hypothetical protein